MGYEDARVLDGRMVGCPRAVVGMGRAGFWLYKG